MSSPPPTCLFMSRAVCTFSAALSNEFVKKREEDAVVGDFAQILVNKVSIFMCLFRNLLVYDITYFLVHCW